MNVLSVILDVPSADERFAKWCLVASLVAVMFVLLRVMFGRKQ